MPLLPTKTTSTTPQREEKSFDTTAAVTPNPCPTPTQIEDVKTIHPIQLGDLLDKISYMKLNSVTTSNFCDASISSLSVAASERDGMLEDEDEEGINRYPISESDKISNTNDDDAAERRLKPLKRCVNTFCFVPTIHDRPSPPRAAKRMRLN